MYTNYEVKQNIRKEIVFYIVTIGNKADSIGQDVIKRLFMKGSKYLSNRRIKRTKFGNFQCNQYSFLVSDGEHLKATQQEIRKILYNEYSNSVKLLTENRRTWYIINQIRY